MGDRSIMGECGQGYRFRRPAVLPVAHSFTEGNFVARGKPMAAAKIGVSNEPCVSRSSRPSADLCADLLVVGSLKRVGSGCRAGTRRRGSPGGSARPVVLPAGRL